MRHLLFPTVQQADAFIQDLLDQGAIRPEIGHTAYRRNSDAVMADPTSTTTMSSGAARIDDLDPDLRGGTAEDAAAGAVKGTAVGAVVGAVAGTVATVATGGLAAVPVILGMTALGSGVGAGVGAIGGAEGVDETSGAAYDPAYGSVTDAQYDRLNTGVNSGGRAIAVDDTVPADVVDAAAARHGGQYV